MSRLTVRASAALLLATAGIASAGPGAAQDSSNGLTLDHPVYMQPAPVTGVETPPTAVPARRPLMMGLDKLGVAKPLDDLGINIYGFAEASYTYSASSPPGNTITGRTFDFEHEDITLNQVDLAIEKTIDLGKVASSKTFDYGFNIETIYGGDARVIHANGLDFYGPGSFQQYPDEQIDVVQAYVDFGLPVGNGLRIRAGKFVTLLGQETINPTANALYSHSYLFGFAIPFTHTGVLATYNVNDKLTVDAGITRGWNQALRDNNGDAIDFLGRITYKIDDKTSVLASATVGPEAAGDAGNWWYVGDLIVTYAASDQLTFALNGDYGFYTHGSGGDAAQWYGLAAYAGYKINDMFTINARGEAYDDNDGFTLTGTPNVVYEATLGVAIHPLTDDIGKNLLIRPEVRYDYAQNAFFDGGTDNGQFTAAVDVIFTF